MPKNKSGGENTPAHNRNKLDVDQRKNQGHNQYHSSLLGATLESTADGIIVLDADGHVITFNQQLQQMWGIPQSLLDRMEKKEIFDYFKDLMEDPWDFQMHMGDLNLNPCLDTCHELKLADGRVFEQYSLPQRIGDQIAGRVFSFRDISIRRNLEDQLIQQSTRDQLTGLPNRILLEDRLDQEIKSAKRHKKKVGVFFFNLDRFKLINDSMGHDIGDALLKEVASRLQNCIRETDTLARWGGDEFVVIMADLDVQHQAIPIIALCQSAIEEIMYIDNSSMNITTCIGVSFYPDDGETTAVLLQNADTAANDAKNSGRNAYRFYTSKMNERALEELALGADLQRALTNKEFFLQYQPLVNISTRRVVSMEALIRWKHPIRGLIPPFDFISLAEESGLIRSIGEWVLRTACRQNKAWQNLGLPPIKIAVNVSGVQFRQPHFLQIVKDALAQSELSPEYLDLELTESVIMENRDSFVSLLDELQEMGVGLVIDDFGTGYSSLSYLKRFPVNKIKIDKSFISDLSNDADNMAIVRAIISMGQKLKLRIVAEGVETEEQLYFLLAQNCDEIQGYYFNRPVDILDCEKILLANYGKHCFLNSILPGALSSTAKKELGGAAVAQSAILFPKGFK